MYLYSLTGSYNYGSDTKPAASTPSYGSTQTKLRFVPSVEFKLTSGECKYSLIDDVTFFVITIIIFKTGCSDQSGFDSNDVLI